MAKDLMMTISPIPGEPVYTPFNMKEAEQGVPFMIEGKSIVKEWHVWRDPSIKNALMVLTEDGSVHYFPLNGIYHNVKLVMIHKYVTLHVIVYKSFNSYNPIGISQDHNWMVHSALFTDYKKAEDEIPRYGYRDARVLGFTVLD